MLFRSVVNEKDHTVNLTDAGVREAERIAGVESFYTVGNMEWPHLLDNALKAHHLYKKDVNYVVKEGQIVIVDENGQERGSFKVPFGAHLKFDEGQEVKRGQRLIEWDPYTNPILTERAGYVKYEDLVEGLSLKEVTDESTGISSKVVLDWRSSARGSDLRPAISIRDKKEIGRAHV